MKKTKVIFVMEQNPCSVLAVFPEISEATDKVSCYSHVGQHSSCDYNYFMSLPQAGPDDFIPLYNEIVAVYGYDLTVVIHSVPSAKKQPSNIDEPIKLAFTSNSVEGRTIIIFKDGGIKVIDQGEDWDVMAIVLNLEPCEVEGGKLDNLKTFEKKELYEIKKALQAP